MSTEEEARLDGNEEEEEPVNEEGGEGAGGEGAKKKKKKKKNKGAGETEGSAIGDISGTKALQEVCVSAK
jgi:hypothetical protein